MAHLSSTGRSAEPANKNQNVEKRSDGSAAAARADDRLSVGKRLIKEPGSNPDHTALPNPLVSSRSAGRVEPRGRGRAGVSSRTRAEANGSVRGKGRKKRFATNARNRKSVKALPGASPPSPMARGSASMGGSMGRSERNTWTERITARAWVRSNTVAGRLVRVRLSRFFGDEVKRREGMRAGIDAARRHGQPRSATRIARRFIWRATWDASTHEGCASAVRGNVARESESESESEKRRRDARRRDDSRGARLAVGIARA